MSTIANYNAVTYLTYLLEEKTNLASEKNDFIKLTISDNMDIWEKRARLFGQAITMYLNTTNQNFTPHDQLQIIEIQIKLVQNPIEYKIQTTIPITNSIKIEIINNYNVLLKTPHVTLGLFQRNHYQPILLQKTFLDVKRKSAP